MWNFGDFLKKVKSEKTMDEEAKQEDQETKENQPDYLFGYSPI